VQSSLCRNRILTEIVGRYIIRESKDIVSNLQKYILSILYMEGKDVMVSNDQISKMLGKIWKTIAIGFGPRTGQAFCRCLRESDFVITHRAESMLKSPDFKVVCRKMCVDLVRVRVRDLGFECDVQRDKVLAMARKFGLFSLNVSLSEVAPHLRLQYLDQPNGEQLLFDMEPIPDYLGNLCMFGVRRIGPERQFYADYGNSKIIYSSEAELIFVRPRRQ